MYTPEMAGSGQYGICVKCNKGPTKEGHDGCIGTLPGSDVMNACCGHGIDDLAYVQFWNSPRLSGADAIDYINKNKPEKRDNNVSENTVPYQSRRQGRCYLHS